MAYDNFQASLRECTVEETAKALGISHSTATKDEANAIRKIREAFQKLGITSCEELIGERVSPNEDLRIANDFKRKRYTPD